jgi:predicted ATPase
LNRFKKAYKKAKEEKLYNEARSTYESTIKEHSGDVWVDLREFDFLHDSIMENAYSLMPTYEKTYYGEAYLQAAVNALRIFELEVEVVEVKPNYKKIIVSGWAS